jgi:hypothetical protein
MSSNRLSLSRRKLLIGGALAVGGIGTGAFLYRSASLRRRNGANRNGAGEGSIPQNLDSHGDRTNHVAFDAFGEQLPLPDEPLFFSIHFSAIDRQFAVACGDLTSKRLYVAEFPPQSSDDYRLVSDVPNCLRLDAVSWCRADPTRIGYVATTVDGEPLPPVVTSSEQRQLAEDSRIREDRLAGGFYVTSLGSGGSEKAFALEPRGEDTLPPAFSSWPETDVVYYCEGNRILRGRLAQGGTRGNVDVMWDASQENGSPSDRSRASGLAYCDDTNLLVTLRRRSFRGQGESRRKSPAKIVGDAIREATEKGESPPDPDTLKALLAQGHVSAEPVTEAAAVMIDENGQVRKEGPTARLHGLLRSQIMLSGEADAILAQTENGLLLGQTATGSVREVPLSFRPPGSLIGYTQHENQAVFAARHADRPPDEFPVLAKHMQFRVGSVV